MNLEVIRALRIGSRINSSTSGSVLFADSSGKLAQDNSNLFWGDTNKRFGIGTASPSRTFQVENAGADVWIKGGVDSGNIFTLGSQTTGAGALYQDIRLLGNDIIFRTATADEGGASADRMIIKHTTGNVGIGTASPNGKVDALSSGTANIYKGIASTGSGQWRVREHSGGSVRMSLFDTSGNEDIQLNPNGNSYIIGNVGIGTASPDAHLEIEGAGHTTPLQRWHTTEDSGKNLDLHYNASPNNFYFDAGTRNIVLETTGNVGIGIDGATDAPDTKLQVVGDTKLGDNNTNYASFAADGELTLTGTARVNKEFRVSLSDFNPGASGPTKALNDIFPTYEFTIGDDMHTSFEMPVDWASGTDITVEVYWAIDEAYATNSAEVRWSADWRAVAVGEVISGGSSGTMDFGDVNIPATANTIVKTTSTIAGASISAQDLVAFNGARVALVAGNNPTAEPYIVDVRVEYISDKLGEAT